MNAEKVTTTITVETLSVDSVKALLVQAIQQFEDEAHSGTLRMADGDQVSWAITREKVEF